VYVLILTGILQLGRTVASFRRRVESTHCYRYNINVDFMFPSTKSLLSSKQASNIRSVSSPTTILRFLLLLLLLLLLFLLLRLFLLILVFFSFAFLYFFFCVMSVRMLRTESTLVLYFCSYSSTTVTIVETSFSVAFVAVSSHILNSIYNDASLLGLSSPPPSLFCRPNANARAVSVTHMMMMMMSTHRCC